MLGCFLFIVYICKLRTHRCLFYCRQEVFFADFSGTILHQAVSRVGKAMFAVLMEGGWLLSTQREVSMSLPHFLAPIHERTCFRWFGFECCAFTCVIGKSKSVVWLQTLAGLGETVVRCHTLQLGIRCLSLCGKNVFLSLSPA